MCTEKCLELAPGSKVSRRAAMVGAAAVAASAALAGTAEAGERGPALSSGRHGLRDLTHPLTTSIPFFAPGEQPERETVATIEDDGYYMQKWHLIEHIGTHVDAPAHFIVGGRLGPELKPSELIVQAVVVNIARRAARDPDTVVTVDDLRAFERRHGRIPRDSAVLMDSGWAAKVGDVAAYRGVDAEGSCTSPGSGPRPPSGCCATGGSAPWVWTPSASIRASRRSSNPPDPARGRPLRGGEPGQPGPDPEARRDHHGRAHPLRGGFGRPGPRLRLLVGPGERPERGPGRLDRLVDPAPNSCPRTRTAAA